MPKGEIDRGKRIDRLRTYVTAQRNKAFDAYEAGSQVTERGFEMRNDEVIAEGIKVRVEALGRQRLLRKMDRVLTEAERKYTR